MMLEAHATDDADIAYPFDIVATNGLLQLNPTPLWRALLDDLDIVPSALIAARFHAGLANALVNIVEALPPLIPSPAKRGRVGRGSIVRLPYPAACSRTGCCSNRYRNAWRPEAFAC